VLEIGCGLAALAFDLSPVTQSVLGIDISPVAAERSRARAAELGLDNLRFATMDAEQLELEDGEVDVVFATGVLHHLDVARAGAELARVLSLGGSALFLEPMGHNPVINAYRARTPSMRTPDEHPLLRGDFDLLRRWFDGVDTRFQHLSTLASVPMRSRPFHSRLVSGLHRVDDALFRVVPALRYHAWYVELDLTRPRPAGSRG
jgi:SAM-dependent methyltransferase